MNTSEKDPLGTLFGRLPAETLPVNFRSELMEKIQKEAVRMQKRRERYALYWIIAASALLIASAAFILYLYGVAQATGTAVPYLREIREAFSIRFPEWPVHPVWLLIGGATFVLLAFDYALHKIFGPYRQKSAPNGL